MTSLVARCRPAGQRRRRAAAGEPRSPARRSTRWRARSASIASSEYSRRSPRAGCARAQRRVRRSSQTGWRMQIVDMIRAYDGALRRARPLSSPVKFSPIGRPQTFLSERSAVRRRAASSAGEKVVVQSEAGSAVGSSCPRRRRCMERRQPARAFAQPRRPEGDGSKT